jgi:hypothetical protein
VKAIVGENAFTGVASSREWVRLFLQHGQKVHEIVASMPLVSGLWVLPSAFNHACFNNATWDTTGDMLFVRTVRAVKKGEEICLSYIRKTASFAERT